MQQSMRAAAAAATDDTSAGVQAPAKQKRPVRVVDQIRSMVEKSNEQLEMLLKTEDKVSRLKREFMTAVQSNPKLLQCDIKSLVGSLIRAAQLDLSLDKTLGQAFIVPYGRIAEFQIGYQGYMELAYRTGKVVDIFAKVVYKGDEFIQSYSLDGAKMHHVPVPPSQRGERIGAYMVAIYRDGGSHYEWMWSEEIERIKALSPSAKRSDSPWRKPESEEAMWKKTVVNRASTYLPLSVEARQSIYIDRLQDEGRGYVDYGKLVDGEEAEVVETTVEEREAA